MCGVCVKTRMDGDLAKLRDEIKRLREQLDQPGHPPLDESADDLPVDFVAKIVKENSPQSNK